MAQQFDFGMIGLGVMGSNLLLNLADHGFKATGFDVKPERGAAQHGRNVDQGARHGGGPE